MNVFFRFLDDDNKPTGWYGVASAQTKRDLFWEIDAFGDPYRCQIASATSFGICFRSNVDLVEESEEEYENDFSSVETTFPYWPGVQWKTPKWPPPFDGVSES